MSTILTPAALHAWLVGPVAALWLERGVDWDGGGYFDQLDFHTATNICGFKRLRVTCRQIFVFARLDALGVAGARDAMEHGLHFLFTRLRHRDGGFIRAVDLSGAVIDDTRDLYDLAFALFSLAAAFERSGAAVLKEDALALLAFLRSKLAHPAGGFVEGLPAALPRRQNPHMHLLEACLAWLPLAEDKVFRELAVELTGLVASHFWITAGSYLCEYFEDDWGLLPQLERRVFEPGHHFEWIWLLGECEKAGIPVPAIAPALAETAMSKGFDAITGLPYGEVSVDGEKVVSTCRIWVITEWLRVCATQQAVGGVERPLTCLTRHLAVPIPGLWYERCDAHTGAFAEEGVPASSLYHIVTGITPLLY